MSTTLRRGDLVEYNGKPYYFQPNGGSCYLYEKPEHVGNTSRKVASPSKASVRPWTKSNPSSALSPVSKRQEPEQKYNFNQQKSPFRGRKIGYESDDDDDDDIEPPQRAEEYQNDHDAGEEEEEKVVGLSMYLAQLSLKIDQLKKERKMVLHQLQSLKLAPM